MAQNVTIAGASYSDVPSIQCPKTGGGTAIFTDVSDTTAAAEDVKSGKYFYTAAGVKTEGTGSGGWSVDTQSITISGSTPTSISFTELEGEPKVFWVKCTGTITSSGSTAYYYIVDVLFDGTNHTGNYMQIGNNRRVYSDDSHYSHTYSDGTLTVSSSAASRSQAGGAFHNSSYELVYFY